MESTTSPFTQKDVNTRLLEIIGKFDYLKKKLSDNKITTGNDLIIYKNGRQINLNQEFSGVITTYMIQLKKYQKYILSLNINQKRISNEIKLYLKKDFKITEVLADLIKEAIDNNVSLKLIKLAQNELQRLRNRWKEEDYTTLICPNKTSTCKNNISSPPIFEKLINKNIHPSFDYVEIKLDNNEFAYYNEYTSSFLCLDDSGNVFAKPTSKDFNTIPTDAIFIKTVIFKGSAIDACNVCKLVNSIYYKF